MTDTIIGIITPVAIRRAELPRENEALARVIATSGEGVDLYQAKRTLRYMVKRFPLGAYVAEREGDVIGVLNLGFLKPAWLTLLLGKFPARVPDLFYRILFQLGVLRKFEVANIVVAPPYRSRGVALQLMEFAEERARKTYKQSAIFLLVGEQNKLAKRFYERLGFEQVNTVVGPGVRKVLMRKDLVGGGATRW